MSIQSTLPAFSSYPARMDYMKAAQQLSSAKYKIVTEELPNIEGWIYTSRGFPVPALCAPFPQFNTAPDLYMAQQILSGARRLIVTGDYFYICEVISRAVMLGDYIITNTLRNYLEECLEDKNTDINTYSSFISTVMFCFSPEVILCNEEHNSNYRDGRIFWIDWMLHQVAQQLTNFAGEQA